MPVLTDYESFEKYFWSNNEAVRHQFEPLHDEFVSLFNGVLEKGRQDFGAKQRGTAAVFYLRATKYLYTAHILALSGHTEESRILLRNVVELLILGFLVSKEQGAFELWQECMRERLKHTMPSGLVEPGEYKKRKYELSHIAKKYKTVLQDDHDVKDLMRTWGEFSTYFTHENLFNLAVRIDQGSGKSELYIGTDHTTVDRMTKSLERTIELLKRVRSLMSKL